jgi:hypothetical protein
MAMANGGSGRSRHRCGWLDTADLDGHVETLLPRLLDEARAGLWHRHADAPIWPDFDAADSLARDWSPVRLFSRVARRSITNTVGAHIGLTLAKELSDCSSELRAYFESVAFQPTKWSQSPYGDKRQGFWAIAAYQDRVLWYNDIEHGSTSLRSAHGERSRPMSTCAIKTS